MSSKTRRRIGTAVLGVGVVIALLAIAMPVMESHDRRQVDALEGDGAPQGFDKSTFTPISEISQPMIVATIAMEDPHFVNHHGFDFAAMHYALRMDVHNLRVVRGGSTITQQLAKNLFLSSNRNLWRKLREACYTVDMEQDLSKRRILELYLNKIDYGYGCTGIKQAASYYFHTIPSKLTLAQSALLVSIVPEPPHVPTPIQTDGEPWYEDRQRCDAGKEHALWCIANNFAGLYSDQQLSDSLHTSLDTLVYPYKDAYDRGATSSIPPVYHGVGFYYYATPSEPETVPTVAPCLVQRIGPFLDDVRAKFGIVGIDHLGVYDDRTMRQSSVEISSHAYGQAIDISGFRFYGGLEIKVADHDNPAVAKKLALIEALLKRHFDIVVDSHSDPLRHRTHFHCEVRGPRADPDLTPLVEPYDPGTEPKWPHGDGVLSPGMRELLD